MMMNTADLDEPFGEKSLDGTLEVAARSVAVLRELTAAEAGQTESDGSEDSLEKTVPVASPAQTEAENPAEEPVPIAQ